MAIKNAMLGIIAWPEQASVPHVIIQMESTPILLAIMYPPVILMMEMIVPSCVLSGIRNRLEAIDLTGSRTSRVYSGKNIPTPMGSVGNVVMMRPARLTLPNLYVVGKIRIILVGWGNCSIRQHRQGIPAQF